MKNQMQLPNPLKTPNFFQRLHWVGDPVGYIEGAAQQYPDMFTANIVSRGPLIFVQHPQAIQKILTNDRKKFIAPGHENRILQPLLGDYSVILLESDRHKQSLQAMATSERVVMGKGKGKG